MQCAISGEIPLEPVACSQGHIFERRLIELYIDKHGKCPVDGAECELDNIIQLQMEPLTNPSQTNLSSVPVLLSTLRQELQSTSFGFITNNQQYQVLLKQLVKASSEVEASVRVIGRLDEENQHLEETVLNLQKQIQRLHSAGEEDIAEESKVVETLTAEICKSLADLAKAMRKQRRRAWKSFQPATPELLESVSNLNIVASHESHSEEPASGVSCLAVHPTNTNMVMSGGLDHKVIVTDITSEDVVATLEGHSGAITQVMFHPTEPIVFSSSADKTAIVWQLNSETNNYEKKFSFTHESEVCGLSLHPSGSYLATAASGQEKEWHLHSLTSGSTLKKFTDEKIASGFSSISFHPDGQVLATGSQDGALSLWDVSVEKLVATLPHHSGALNCMHFSENGYYLATGADDGIVHLWDLRKPSAPMESLKIQSGPIRSVNFDVSGHFLGVASSDLRIYSTADWTLQNSMSDHSAECTGVFVGSDASCVVSCSMDRMMKVYRI
eukprot:TRINITY_DN5574_c0_g1_i1.p1 TRINITY_DN5574_c0_g1~~TRINITY_DN5574_c0_g1_i1.p1  ORF type:complete len:499 (+),score=146.37 TRINITY_DN5574_c0_g1_i1:53-1549(+)